MSLFKLMAGKNINIPVSKQNIAIIATNAGPKAPKRSAGRTRLPSLRNIMDSDYFSRIKTLIGVPEKSQCSRILFSR